MTFAEMLNIPPYSLDREEKERVLTERLSELTEHHKRNCPEYARILDALYDGKGTMTYAEQGTKYEGEWKNNLKDGIGKMTGACRRKT